MNNAPNKKDIIVVTPVYEDKESSSILFKELARVFKRKVFIVAVDDGSVHQPVEILNIKNAEINGLVIKLKRNVGHQRAIAIGLNYVLNNFKNISKVIVMDSDGEDDPESIKSLLSLLESDEIDMVVAERKSRIETLSFKTFYSVYKWLFFILSGQRISFGNFMALKPTALKRMVAMQELWIHTAACALASKLRMKTCSLDRGPRYAGKSKMNFVGLALHGFKGLMVFAEDVLVRVGIACAVVAAFSILGVFIAITLKIIGFATPGWFSVAFGILLLVFIQTGTLTLTILMLTGLFKGGHIANIDYEKFIDKIQNDQPRKKN